MSDKSLSEKFHEQLMTLHMAWVLFWLKILKKVGFKYFLLNSANTVFVLSGFDRTVVAEGS